MNNYQEFTEEIRLKDGRSITLSTGKLAKQADGAVVVKMGGTMLLATVVGAKEAKDGVDFMPLTVEYREKFSAAGKIPGGFIKREGRPTDDEILTMRLVDRVMRPLFPKDYHAEVQVIISVMSYDGTVIPDSLAGLAASTAMALTDIPFKSLISEVRVVRVDGELLINPDLETLKKADLDIMVGASKDSVVMVEGEMNEISEKEMVEAIKFAHEAIKEQIEAQERLAEKVGKSFPKREYCHEVNDEALEQRIHDELYQKLYDVAKEPSDKHERSEKFDAVLAEFKAQFSEEELEEKEALIDKYFGDTKKEAVRQMILNENVRLDGRNPKEIRPIWCEVDYLPATHGSSIFTRGETQSLSTVTLGSSLDVDRIDSIVEEYDKKFYLHYNFPPFSTGEARPIRGTSRREVGHGNLAERALKKMIPADNPYTIRLVSEILESNGSSSMATVCAGTLALMDAGIKIKKPVSGIAMGLITDTESGKWTVLSDILGDEDHLGDMDFKVTGTRDGITACQMDIKIAGLSYEILEKALMQAHEGRMHILDKILETIPEPNENYKPTAPKIVTLRIKGDFIGAVIGPGGKVIQELQAETGTTISIEEDGDFGVVEISGVDQNGMDAAVQRIKDITFEPEIGGVYKGTVVSIKPFGAFVQIKKGVEGLVHISELEWSRVNDVEDVVKVGDEIEVKYLENDKKTGKMRLSRKVLLPKPEKKD
ncbi:polyribonucleotide nucleotidyltransferase [Ornithobacterium rhinotracheale]|uniref:Polyribonucleotide nucleotidyltransferase n=1 Tax=Ornithobacterium rhinotracheale (strain ATCC 51463 / DSM 15997 / CCUG 23171 / CIP 104009 / LMG 9086) TaxID=867902 RepID=I3ZXW8_ORNRL|nr:polyribonucleotide nucleotidyltransferase [Ornithobacterium rhinotracheale]AFL96552.1 polyribonucleotide nucleotidyltransferase [Ornithobacterium rhinotracheale DSM 15997]AIP98739.1 polynucleotide phosphorylase [Ornithobacterium rhinotracheale ORT-UMN 88]KGB67712.1 polynucleotide phosphorylase [Ornithobacterium rhinotracheale H06-030791]MCK0194876.1 polyribonucleotide nucleotidyltransferase [Ornithobacterium rhinotracheale]UOH62882.1 polyribonucleotide nucleotidyltransferase [Ornithobacteri